MAQSLFLEGQSPVDFIYLDRNRLASLTGQLSGKGVLTELKSTVGKTHNTEGHVRGTVAIAATGVGRSRALSESLEEVYDPFWTHAFTFLQDLVTNFAVPLEKGRIGSLVSFQAVIQFVDLRLMRDLWEPSMRAFLGSQQAPAESRQQKRRQAKNAGPPKSLPAEAQLTLQILQGMPHLFHMTFVSEGGVALWAAVEPAHLTIASENLAMKFGSAIDGVWTVVGIVDGKAGPPDAPLPTGSDMLDAAVAAFAYLRSVVGRPQTHFGLTPIAIYAPLLGIAEIDASMDAPGAEIQRG